MILSLYRSIVLLFFICLSTSVAYAIEIEKFNLKLTQEPVAEARLKFTDYSVDLSITLLLVDDVRIDADCSGIIRRDKNNVLILRLNASRFFINNEAIKDVALDINVKKDSLVIRYIKSPNGYISGKLNFVENQPHLDLNLDIKGISLTHLLRIAGVDNFPLSGDFRGRIMLRGIWNKPLIDGTLQGFNGNLPDLPFSKAELRFKGIYPRLEINDSYISVTDYDLDMNGIVNFIPVAKASREKNVSTGKFGYLDYQTHTYKFTNNSYLTFTLAETTNTMSQTLFEF